MNDKGGASNTPPQARFIRDSSLFSMTLVLGGICRLIRGFFIAKFLGPHGFGIWRFVNIFSEYLQFASLGTHHAIRRTVPFLRGKGDLEGVQSVLTTASAITFFCSIIYTLVVFAWSFFLTDTYTAKALVAFTPVILFLAWLKYAQDFSLATALYDLRRRLETIDFTLSLVLCVLLAFFWGVYGAIAGLGISALITVVISFRQLWRFLSLAINWRIVRDLVVTGLPIMADTILMITMANSDRIMIAAMLSAQVLGVYSVGAAGVSVLGTIPSAIGQMLFVKFAEMDGSNRSKEHISDVLDRTTVILSSVLAPILSLAIAFFPVAVVYLLPAYVEGIGPGKLLIAAVFFLGISVPTTKLCVSTGRFVGVLTLRLVVVGLEFAVLYFAILNGAGLHIIALCVLLSFVIFHAGIVMACNYYLENPVGLGITAAIKGMLPFLSVLLGLYAQWYFYSAGVYIASLELVVSCTIGLLVSLAASVPFLIWANRRTHVIDLLLNGSVRLTLAKVTRGRSAISPTSR